MANEYINATVEKVRETLETCYEVAGKNTFYGMMQKVPAHTITKTTNATDFRIPLEMTEPGVYGAANFDGGALLSGSKGNIKQMYQTFFPVQLAFTLSLQDILTTDSREKAVVNAFTNMMKRAPKTFMKYANAGLHSLGSAQGFVALGTAVTSVGAGTETVTCATANGANLITPGMRLEIYSNDLNTHRTSAIPNSLPYVTSVNKTAGTFVIAGLGAITPAATDYYAFAGTGTTPAWSNGLGYFHNIATSGNLLGLAKGTYAELNINPVNAASGLLVPDHVSQATQMIEQRLGEVPKLTGLIHPAQMSQIANLNLSISTLMRGKSDSAIDVAVKMGDSVPLGGVEFYKDIAQDKTRLEICNMSKWLRVELAKKDFFKIPTTDQYIRLVNEATTARPTFAVEFTMIGSENYANVLPAGEAVVYGLAVPSGH